MEMQVKLELETNKVESTPKPTTPQLNLARLTKKPFSIQTNQELAKKLNWKSTQLLTKLGLNKSEHYSIISIPKKGKNGRFRILHNPDSLMRAIQYRILTRVLERLTVPDYVYAFERGKSIPEMAGRHIGKHIVVSFDLKDFFKSIKQYHLFQMFEHIGFGAAPARTLSELCTYKSFVPQGALTSPKISNIITALTFGPTIKQYCDSKGYTLTIYADDITVSFDTERKLVRTEIEELAREIQTTVASAVGAYGFRINHSKTKIMANYQRQYVCGVVVNRMINLQKSERNKLRAIVHNCRKNGLDVEAAKNKMSAEKFYSVVMGRLNWFGQLNPIAGKRLIGLFNLLNPLGHGISQPNGQGPESISVVASGGPKLIKESVQPSEEPDVAPW